MGDNPYLAAHSRAAWFSGFAARVRRWTEDLLLPTPTQGLIKLYQSNKLVALSLRQP